MDITKLNLDKLGLNSNSNISRFLIETRDDQEEKPDIIDDPSVIDDPVIVETPVINTILNKYLVQVTAKRLNYFSGPGKNYSIIGTAGMLDKFTIVEEIIGADGLKWGKIDSALNSKWIPLNYCKRVKS